MIVWRIYMGNNNEQKNNDSKKILTLIVLIATLMITTTGATYAYFAFAPTASTNTLTATAATASLEFRASCPGGAASTPTLIAPTAASSYAGKPMVPQKALNGTTNVLQKALTGASGKDKCVDGNGNVICHAYTFTVANCSTAAAVIKGQIKFTWASGSSFANLKWKLMTNATTVAASSGNAGTAATTSYANFATNVSLAPSAVQQYWLIVWIEETGVAQNSTDYGTWYGTINIVNNVDGTGITSTITS